MSKKSDVGDEDFDRSNSEKTSTRSSNQDESTNLEIKTSHGISSELRRNNLDRYTPNTQFEDYQEEIFGDENNLPDLKIKCPSCETYLSLEELKDHNEYHEALIFFSITDLPKTEEQLIEKRKTLIKSLSTAYLNNPKDIDHDEKINQWHLKVKEINDAYELIKSHMNNTFETIRQLKNNSLKFDVQGESQLTSNESIVAIGTCSIQNKKHRINMEDSNVILDRFGDNENLTYIGTFDGYDGFVASNKCSIHLHLGILHYLSKSSLNTNDYIKLGYYDEDEINNLAKYYTSKQDIDYFKEMKSIKPDSSRNRIKNENIFDLNNVNEKDNLNEFEYQLIHEYRNSFKYAYKQMDKLLSRGKDETSKTRWSGSTGVTCIIENIPETKTSWIHVANCGDVEAIVITYDKNIKKYQKNIQKTRKYKILTRLHTLNDCVQDRENLIRKGCNIVESSKGNRTIKGIYSFTRALGFNGDRSIKSFISSSPSVKSIKIESNYACLILATKGFWNVLSYEKVADITNDLFNSYSRSFNLGRESQRFQGLNILDPSSFAKIEESIENNNKIIEESDEDDMSKITLSNKTVSHSIISSSSSRISSSKSSSKPASQLIESNDQKDVEESEHYYTKSSRAKTAPVSRLSQYDEKSKPTIKCQKSLSYIDDLNMQTNNNPENILDSKVNKQPILVEPIDSSKFKSNSDIYPSSKKNALINESHDNYIDLKEMELIEKSAIKHVYMSNSTFGSDSTNDQDNSNDESDLFNVNKSKISKNEKTKNEVLPKIIDLTPYNVKAAQVTEYDLKKSNLSLMKDRRMARKLEFSQLLAENLVKCALLAGSVDNITVNCVLLNDSIF